MVKHRDFFSWLLVKGGYTMALKIASMVITLVFVSVLSFWLPAADYGLVAILISTALLASAVGGFGQQELMVRDVSQALASGDGPKANELIRQSTNWVFYLSGFTGILIWFVFWLMDYGVVWSICACLLVVLISINQTFSGAARAYDKYFWSLAPREILWRTAIICLVGLAVITGYQVTSDDVAVISVIVLFGLVLLQGKVLKIELNGVFPRPILAGYGDRLRSSLDLMLVNLSGIGLSTLDVIVVGAFISESSVAEYYPANRLALVAGFVAFAYRVVVGPRIARAFKSGDKLTVAKLNSMAALLSFFMSVLIGVLLIFGFPFYKVMFPTATVGTQEVLFLLVSAQVVQSALGCGETILLMSGNEKILRRINVYVFALACVALVVAAVSGSFICVAFVCAVATLLRKIVVTVVSYNLTGIYPFQISR